MKNLWFNRKQYVFFAVFLILIQSLISGIILFSYNGNRNEIRYLEEQCVVKTEDQTAAYTYHLSLGNMSPEALASLINTYNGTQASQREWDLVLAKRVGDTGKGYAYIRFLEKNGQSAYSRYRNFCVSEIYRSIVSDPKVTVEITPLLTAIQNEANQNSATAWICLAITAVGAIMFGLLFNTVVNHFKFSYGIYMTYGANFKKLLVSALCEMLILDLVTVVPSFLLSILITYLLTLRAGYGIHVLVFPLFVALLCSFVLTLVSVTAVIFRLSRQTPNKLISSVNNVGLISSPRRSAELPAKGFPVKTELLAMRRFRRYLITLVLSSLIFAGAFCGGVYAMEAQQQRENIEKAQFVLHFPEGHATASQSADSDVTPDSDMPVTDETAAVGSDAEEEEEPPRDFATGQTYTPEIRAYLESIDGMKFVSKNRVYPAYVPEHFLVDSDKVTWAGRSQSVSANARKRAFTNLDYYLTDEEVIDDLRRLGYEITGDIDAVLDGDHVIAISDSVNNAVSLNLQPGDKIRIARQKMQTHQLHLENAVTDLERMECYLYSFSYGYEEYTIGAVISGIPTGAGLPLYVNASDFKSLTGTDAYFVDVALFMQEDVTSEQVRKAGMELDRLALAYDMTYENTFYHTEKTAQAIRNYPGVILYISLLLLAGFVLIVSLSQALFYLMRKQELDVYLCLGCNFKTIRKLFLVDGAFFSGLFAVCYSVFAIFFDFLVYRILNSRFFGEASVRLYFHIPALAFWGGLVVVVLTGFASVMTSYHSFKKHSEPVFTGAAVLSLDPKDVPTYNKSDIFDSDMR